MSFWPDNPEDQRCMGQLIFDQRRLNRIIELSSDICEAIERAKFFHVMKDPCGENTEEYKRIEHYQRLLKEFKSAVA